MPDILKRSNGEIDWTKIFMAFGAMTVLILQQWQSYRIAEIQTQGKINSIQFMKKDEVVRRLDHMDDTFMKKDELLLHLRKLEQSHGVSYENK